VRDEEVVEEVMVEVGLFVEEGGWLIMFSLFLGFRERPTWRWEVSLLFFSCGILRISVLFFC